MWNWFLPNCFPKHQTTLSQKWIWWENVLVISLSKIWQWRGREYRNLKSLLGKDCGWVNLKVCLLIYTDKSRALAQMQKRLECQESWSLQYDNTYGWFEQSSKISGTPQSRSGCSNCKEPNGGVTLVRVLSSLLFCSFFYFFYF